VTNRAIHLRPIERADLPFLRDLANDPVVRAQVGGWDWPWSLAGQEDWFARQLGADGPRRFIVTDEQSEPVGLAGFWDIDWHNRTASVALKLGGPRETRRRGYGFATLQALMAMGFLDVGFAKLWATILATNDASRGLFAKCGWREEGRFREHVWRDGTRCDLVQVGLLRADYDAWLASQGTEH